jgi:hypothetical protein
MNLGLRDTFDHASWRAAVGTAVSYGVILLAMFLLMFVLPFVVFLIL